VEIEGFGQSYAIAGAEDPAILLFDIRAAFPSLAHFWLFVVLLRMGVPRAIIAAIKALYRKGLATVVLLGARWGELSDPQWHQAGLSCLGHFVCIGHRPVRSLHHEHVGP
jgi:hypothetical protein